jgi:hypothetical protein
MPIRLNVRDNFQQEFSSRPRNEPVSSLDYEFDVFLKHDYDYVIIAGIICYKGFAINMYDKYQINMCLVIMISNIQSSQNINSSVQKDTHLTRIQKFLCSFHQT